MAKLKCHDCGLVYVDQPRGNMKDLVLIHTDNYQNWTLGTHHPTHGIRYVNAYNNIVKVVEVANIELDVREPSKRDIRSLLERIHEPDYVAKVIDTHESDEWMGRNETLSRLAQMLASGTLDALDLLLQGETLTAVHLPGAKHHAQYDHSSGFCVFADFALAADIATDQGLKVAILDFDAHHGDGTENLTLENMNVMTFSIHEKGLFPGTGLADISEKFAYNRPLVARETDGEDLVTLVDEFCNLAKDFSADIVFVAAGADGHKTDPLSNLQWEIRDYELVAHNLRIAFPATPILLGGAGGYQPHDITPKVWAQISLSLTGMKI